MRKLSEIPYPERYGFCPKCKEEFIIDLPPPRNRCPNELATLIVFDTLEALEAFKETLHASTSS